jgi:hypothetical protein
LKPGRGLVLAFHFRGVLAILGYLISVCLTFISRQQPVKGGWCNAELQH